MLWPIWGFRTSINIAPRLAVGSSIVAVAATATAGISVVPPPGPDSPSGSPVDLRTLCRPGRPLVLNFG